MKLAPFICAAAISATALGADKKMDSAQLEEGTKLQLFLDRANFGPGKIDGRGGEFTRKALERYRTANGLPAGAPAAEKKPAAGGKEPVEKLDTAGLDLATITPVFISYTITKDDVAGVGEIPEEKAAQAKLKSLPYRTVLEGVAERFHADVDLIRELNREAKTDALKEGDQLTVPNAEPFELAAVKELKPGQDAATTGVNEGGDDVAEAKKDDNASPAKTAGKEDASSISVRISTIEKILEVYDGEKLRAAFPVTPGSDEIPTPTGKWKVKGVAKMPEFRYDKKMLKEGVRSSDAHLLPPGPNSPVGVMWIALNKKGIGIHGTDDPDTIGRAASHGCVRMANWDVVKLAGLVKAGVGVTIE